jgi:hypothetical protein
MKSAQGFPLGVFCGLERSGRERGVDKRESIST